MANIDLDSQHLQPYDVFESPQKQGNLTGPPRIVRDSIADLYNYIQEWNGEHLKGMALISEICSIKIWHLNKSKFIKNDYPAGLQDYFDRFQEIYNSMELIVSNLKKITNHLEGVMKLYEMKKIITPIFNSWTIQEYVTMSKNVCKMYEEELQLKLYIKENIGHSSSVENVLLYQTIWVQQPYIDKLDLQIEAMLKETSLRQ
ncbi:hypothetical protein O3M35_000467 [Rhynocoris fuscipes]|uniref:Uncharacterized protein n=1 Tax=Rhynocoris fuscipes TaxID=488301 RepID=A0AAW1DMB1_9HEMI